GGLVPVALAAAARAADDPERHQSAAVRHAEGHHGREEKGTARRARPGTCAGHAAHRRNPGSGAVEADADALGHGCRTGVSARRRAPRPALTTPASAPSAPGAGPGASR